MATNSANLLSSPPLPEAPCHRSPPRYPDFYGKHRKQVELQILNREIGFLKEELQSVGDLKPASSCCKEYAVMLVDEFVGTNPDPLILQNLKIHRPFCIWKWLCGKSCFNASWICCYSGCLLHLERPCCACDPSRNCQCCRRRSGCCLEKPCCRSCCLLSSPSCKDCSFRCVWSCIGCRKVCHCQTCTRNCCLPCCLCS
ncbi:hypothetical protein AAC387_Pa02g5197 [Persea americana]